ncbi:MAG: SRPBCC family protein, partial [Gemmatimonadota bacterium]|nr:SRPBCC family protein [Gemmatimonadota bacterium]
GEGSFTIVEAEPLRSVRYEVSIQQGAMITRGVILLEPTEMGTRVVWREEGDFGWNPLMGYWALAMDRSQGAEMEKNLESLRRLAESGSEPPSPPPPPSDRNEEAAPSR